MGKSVAMADTLQQLDAKFVESERSCVQMRTTNAALLDKVMEAEDKVKDVEADLKIEREWRERLQEASVTDKESLAAAKQEIDFLRQVSRDYDNLRQENAKLREQVLKKVNKHWKSLVNSSPGPSFRCFHSKNR